MMYENKMTLQSYDRAFAVWNEEEGTIDLKGIQQPRGTKLVHVQRHEDFVVLVMHEPGYSENPGSRHSGLKSYYPAEMSIRIVPKGKMKDENSGWSYPMAAWYTSKKQRKAGG